MVTRQVKSVPDVVLELLELFIIRTGAFSEKKFPDRLENQLVGMMSASTPTDLRLEIVPLQTCSSALII